MNYTSGGGVLYSCPYRRGTHLSVLTFWRSYTLGQAGKGSRIAYSQWSKDQNTMYYVLHIHYMKGWNEAPCTKHMHNEQIRCNISKACSSICMYMMLTVDEHKVKYVHNMTWLESLGHLILSWVSLQMNSIKDGFFSWCQLKLMYGIHFHLTQGISWRKFPCCSQKMVSITYIHDAVWLGCKLSWPRLCLIDCSLPRTLNSQNAKLSLTVDCHSGNATVDGATCRLCCCMSALSTNRWRQANCTSNVETGELHLQVSWTSFEITSCFSMQTVDSG